MGRTFKQFSPNFISVGGPLVVSLVKEPSQGHFKAVIIWASHIFHLMFVPPAINSWFSDINIHNQVASSCINSRISLALEP